MTRTWLCAGLVAAACSGGSADVPPPDAAADVTPIDGAATPDAVPGDGPNASPDGPHVAAGTCAVVRRIDVGAADQSATFVRFGGAFRAGSWGHVSPPGVRSSVVGDDAIVRSVTLPAADDVYVRVAIGPDAFAGNEIWVRRERNPDFVNPMFARVVGPAVTTATEHEIGEVFARASAGIDVATSFDGARALMVSGHIATHAPRLFMMDANGARVGDVTQLSAPSAEILFDCLEATPTKHGGATSLVAVDPTVAFRLVEFGPDGRPGRAAQITWPTLRISGGCPTVRATSAGYRVVAPLGEGKYRLFELEGEPLFNVDRVPVDATLPSAPLWAGAGRRGGFALLIPAAGSTTMIAVDESGNASEVQPGLPSGTVIPSEPGRLFLHVHHLGQPGTREIVEIACNDPRVVFD